MTHASMDPLRKAAVLLASLEPATAGILLQQMDPQQAQRVREVLCVLGPVDDDEREAVVREFFASGAAAALETQDSPSPDAAHRASFDPSSDGRSLGAQQPATTAGMRTTAPNIVGQTNNASSLARGDATAPASPEVSAGRPSRQRARAGVVPSPRNLPPDGMARDAAGVELMFDSHAAAGGASPAQSASSLEPHCAAPSSELPRDASHDESAARRRRAFGFLEAATTSDLKPCLTGEHPQTIALVIAYLPPARAAQLLSELPGSLQAEVLRRLAHLSEPDPEVLSEVERELQSRLARQRGSPLAPGSGMQRVARILEGMPLHLQRRLWHQLQQYDAALARQWSPPEFTYEQFLDLDEESVLSVLATLDPELAVLALADSPSEFVHRILQHMAPREARLLRYALDHLGPTRLSDVERAKQEVVQAALRLELDGRIRLHRSAMTLVA
jgi:flagellar motor switch protein FliG